MHYFGPKRTTDSPHNPPPCPVSCAAGSTPSPCWSDIPSTDSAPQPTNAPSAGRSFRGESCSSRSNPSPPAVRRLFADNRIARSSVAMQTCTSFASSADAGGCCIAPPSTFAAIGEGFDWPVHPLEEKFHLTERIQNECRQETGYTVFSVVF